MSSKEDKTKELEKLKTIFYNPKTGFSNLKKLKEEVKKNNIKLTGAEIETFYKNQDVNSMFKPIRKPKYFNSITANYAGHIYQIDIINYQRYKYNNYQYILVVIDIFSRFVQAEAMTNRRLSTIIKAFENILTRIPPPYKLQCDNEFNKKSFIDVLEKYDIEPSFFDPYEINKNALVERVNATILMILQKIRLATSKFNWNKYLDDVIENYNNSIHSTVKHRPIDIFKGKETNEQDIIKITYKLSAGDKVRKVLSKKAFDKIDTIRLSKNIYTIEKVNKNKIKLFEDDKLYKPYELKQVYEI
jgi:hypothetical protein